MKLSDKIQFFKLNKKDTLHIAGGFYGCVARIWWYYLIRGIWKI